MAISPLVLASHKGNNSRSKSEGKSKGNQICQSIPASVVISMRSCFAKATIILMGWCYMLLMGLGPWPLSAASAAAVMDPAPAFISPGSVQFRFNSCPITAAKTALNLEKFLGDWYVLEYENQKELRFSDISCVGLHFSETGFGDIITNFTFRYPSKVGFFYHVPIFSIATKVQSSIWETSFRGGMISVVVDTDYDSWAVLVQCSEQGSGEPTFSSTRILSRSRSLNAAGWVQVQRAIEKTATVAPYRYAIDHDVCQELDSI